MSDLESQKELAERFNKVSGIDFGANAFEKMTNEDIEWLLEAYDNTSEPVKNAEKQTLKSSQFSKEELAERFNKVSGIDFGVNAFEKMTNEDIEWLLEAYGHTYEPEKDTDKQSLKSAQAPESSQSSKTTQPPESAQPPESTQSPKSEQTSKPVQPSKSAHPSESESDMGKTFGYIRDVVIIFLFMFAIGVSAYYWHNKEYFTPEVSNGSESVNMINKVLEKQVTDIN